MRLGSVFVLAFATLSFRILPRLEKISNRVSASRAELHIMFLICTRYVARGLFAMTAELSSKWPSLYILSCLPSKSIKWDWGNSTSTFSILVRTVARGHA